MTMHLVGAYLSTTNYNRKKSKKKKTAKQLKAEAEHNKFLRKMGVHPDQLSLKKAVRNSTHKPKKKFIRNNNIKTSDSIPTGVAVKPEAKVYSGKQVLLGIATMHKSNMVPVFSKKTAEDIAKMRR